MDEQTAFTQDVFWDFKALIQVRHDHIPMTWVPSADLDLNKEHGGLETLHFSPKGHSIEATFVPLKPVQATRRRAAKVVEASVALATVAEPIETTKAPELQPVT